MEGKTPQSSLSPPSNEDVVRELGYYRTAYQELCQQLHKLKGENEQLKKDNEQLKKDNDQLRKSHAEDIAAAEYTIWNQQLTIECLSQVPAGPADQHAPFAIENDPDHPGDAPNIREQLNDDAGPQGIDVVSNIATNSDFPDD